MKVAHNIITFNNKVVGQEHCEMHDITYNKVETLGGIVGKCPECWKLGIESEDLKLIEKAEGTREGWQNSFIREHERIAANLEDVKVNGYIVHNESQKQAKQAIAGYIKNFPENKDKSLILLGGSGLGKSHLMYAAAKAIRDQGNKVWFTKTQDLLRLIQGTWGHDAKYSEEYIERVIETIDLLCIDDFGSEYVKPMEGQAESWASTILYNILESRIDKAIMVTSNYRLDGLIKKYGANGERIKSRMIDKANVIEISGDDYRAKRA